MQVKTAVSLRVTGYYLDIFTPDDALYGCTDFQHKIILALHNKSVQKGS